MLISYRLQQGYRPQIQQNIYSIELADGKFYSYLPLLLQEKWICILVFLQCIYQADNLI